MSNRPRNRLEPFDIIQDMNTLIIRKAKIEELEIIQKLNYQLFLLEKKFDSLLNMNWPFGKAGKDFFKKRINDKTGACFVAELNGEIVGYLAGSLAKTYSYRTIKKVTELENTLIKEEFRGQGIGEKLFEKFADWSKSMGVQRIKVSASTSNMRAIKFYEKVGFIPYTSELEYEIK
jgi:diamine N-acetyltransferase